MLINSKWLLKSFSISENTSCLVFQENGVFVAYEDSNDIKAGEDGEVHEWRYEHDELILNYNNGYCTYRGIVISDHYTGKASNQDGFEWTFEAKLLLDKSSQQQLNLGRLVLNYQWLLKPYYDSRCTRPINESNNRYIRFFPDNSLEYLYNRQESLSSEKKDSWVVLDNRIVARVRWVDLRYVSYIFIQQRGQLAGKAKNRAGGQWFFRALPYSRIEDLEGLSSEHEVVFHDTSFTHQKINSIGEYRKYWLTKDLVYNPDFDKYSADILALKRNSDSAIQKFYNLVAPLISSSEVCLCYVPSSTKENLNTGVRQLAMKLASHAQRTNATGCIVRTQTIPKAAHGGERSREIQLGSLAVRQAELIQGKTVILLDDVTTTGTSLEVCQDLLIVAGAKIVYCLALGQTA